MAFDSDQGENLCRFLTDKDHYSSAKHIVRPTAFFPPRNNRLSVYWITDCPEAEVWAIGDEHVAPARGPILGQGIVNSLVAYNDASLTVNVTGVPHARHADLIGWDEDRKKGRLQATKLADKARLKLKE